MSCVHSVYAAIVLPDITKAELALDSDLNNHMCEKRETCSDVSANLDRYSQLFWERHVGRAEFSNNVKDGIQQNSVCRRKEHCNFRGFINA